VSAYDQESWVAATSLPDSLVPSPAELWEALSDPELSPLETARSRVSSNALLRAAVAQSMFAEGEPFESILERLRTEYGVSIRAATLERLLAARVERGSWKLKFTNLVSGRFTELLFCEAYNQQLADVGLTVDEETLFHSFLDYRLVATSPDEDFELSINVKNAGVQMRDAMGFFGLEPQDTLPMATYKAFGAAGAAIPPLLYAYLVDWELLEKLRRTYWEDALTEFEQYIFQVLANCKGVSRALEDDFIAATVDERMETLLAGVGYDESRLADLPFRVISAARCHQIFYENHRRSPYVFIRKMNTDPNVHISVEDETILFCDLIETHLANAESRAELLEGLTRTRAMLIPDPPI
jgi:hypothetical protein